MTSGRHPDAETAAEGIQAAIAEFVQFVEDLGDEALDVFVPGEERSVRVMLYHVASGLRLAPEWLSYARRGEAVPGDDINAYNAQEALDQSAVTREEVLAAITTQHDEAVEAVRSLTAKEWDRQVSFGPGGGIDMPVSTLATAGERHIRRHLENIRAALAAADAAYSR